MAHKTSFALTLTIFLLGVLPVQAAGQPSPENAQEAAPSTLRPDEAFAAFVDRYFDGYFHFSPALATGAGIHEYDAELPTYSRPEVEGEIERGRKALDELKRIPFTALSADHRFDARLLENSIRGHLLDLEKIRMWEKNPDFYNGAVSHALFVLVQRDFAPVDQRLKSLIARERKVPEILRSARQNLSNPPAIYTSIAIRQVTSEIDFFEKDLPLAIAGAHDASLKAEFEEVNRSAIEAYEGFLDFLKKDLAPRSRGTFAIGTENYRRKLLYNESVDVPLERLVRLGEHELRKTQAALRSTAALIDPSKPPAQLLKDLSADHPDSEHVIAESQAVLDNLRKFVVTHQIATILSPENPRVVETPPFMRVLTFASMDSSGPFEESSTEAFYNVTLPEPGWSDAQKDQHLRFFNRYSIQGTSIHEVFPGHYVQFLWVRRTPSKVRKLLGSSSNAEGWAHYTEQMMLEQGYGEGDPKLLLFQLQAALMRLCRYLVGLRMHTRGMTLEEGIAFFEREGFQERVNAEREAMRGTSDPTYLVYTLGKLQILRLREDYKRKMGGRFKLQEFHDRFLSFGYPPVKFIRREMLGNDSPTL